MLDLGKIGGCTSNERWPEDGGAPQTGYARITASIRYSIHSEKTSLLESEVFSM